MDRFVLRPLLESFLREDVGSGDITSEAAIPPGQMGRAVFVAKESFITAGIEAIATEVFCLCGETRVVHACRDGHAATPGETILTVEGQTLALLKAERVALNLAQRLSGIATLTRRFVDAVAPLPVRIVDTRKTTPGLRVLEKDAVRVGGGRNHRLGLSDGILIKDNHIAACGGSVAEAVRRVRGRAPHSLRIQVEAASLDQVRDCLTCGVDAILLDNMDLATLRAAVGLAHGKALLEASGGMNLDNVRAVAETGVDLISIGALTHSAKACDISMRLAPLS